MVTTVVRDRGVRSPQQVILLAGITILAASACGGEYEPEIQQARYAYKHPPPSTPAPWTYVLTCYGGPSDSSSYMGTPACGGKKVDGQWWYSTGAYSFGCGAKLELCANGKCAVVKVVDNGPAAWVETNAKSTCGGTGYILDTSPLVTQHLFGLSCAGWSDCKQITVQPVPDSTPEGPSTSQTQSPPPQPTPPPTPECDPNSASNVRLCNHCGGQHCQGDGTWANVCQPRPDLFPCPAGQSCDASGYCVGSQSPPPPTPQPPPPTPECDPNSASNVRRCNDCGGQHCQANGAWSAVCQPRPGLFPCPAGQSCDAGGFCLGSSSPPSSSSQNSGSGPDESTSANQGAPPWPPSSSDGSVIEGGCSTAPAQRGEGSLLFGLLLAVGLWLARKSAWRR